MGMEQEKEWAEAQRIAVSVDLVEAAKKQLEFLAAVDRNRYLYQGPALQWAIYRYNAFWLPLLAKHTENPISEDPLVVPLDCEWIWHCHRLNPVTYKLDCEKLFGRILGNHNVISSVQATSKSKTEEIWNKMYPEEPYQLDFRRPFPGDLLQGSSQHDKFTSYDLVSAVTRQIPFTFQISRPHISDDIFLQEAVARYKGFLHLIGTNRKNSLKRFCVPTYDVDLIWHTHQLHPVSYCKDLTELLGKVLEHDDTDSDRTKGKKLDTGFSETTRQWEETFGLRYWKAGAMYRGSAPTPVTQIPFLSNLGSKESIASENIVKLIQSPVIKATEVLLEFVEIRNPPTGCKGRFLVSFSKKQPDKLFNTKRSLSILSESVEKQVAYFQCEPTGEFLFELLSCSPSNKPMQKSSKLIGSCSLSVQELLASGSQLSVDKWLSVKPISGLKPSEPILLHVSVSFTPPSPATESFHLAWSKPSFKNSCLFPLLKGGKVKDSKTWTHVTDDDGKRIFGLQTREVMKDSAKCTPGLLKEVQCITDSGQTHTLAEFTGIYWSILGTHGSFKLQNIAGDDAIFELIGHKMVKLYPGRKLDFEPRHSGQQRLEQDFVTAVEFSTLHPYGRAVALIDIKSGTVKVMDDWIVLPGITLALILSEICNEEDYFGLKSSSKENQENQVTTSPADTASEMQATVVMDKCSEDKANPMQAVPGSGDLDSDSVAPRQNTVNSGGCGANCGGACGNMANSSGCGSGCGGGCGGGCGSMTACGGGCGGGCGSMTACGGGCGGGCGGSCGALAACGGGCGGCGGGCGAMTKSGGCGSGCGGGGGCGGCGINTVSDGCNLGSNDMPQMVSSLMNEPVAA